MDFQKKKKLMYVLIFLCIHTIIISPEIPTFGHHIPGEAGSASGLPGNGRILVRAGRYSPVGRPPKELDGFLGRPAHSRISGQLQARTYTCGEKTHSLSEQQL